MKIKEIISESATSVVYHYTSIESALNIIKTDKFILGAPDSVEFSQSGYSYYMSVARVPYGGYATGYSGSSGCTFVIDGRRWSTRHKVVPYSYYNGYRTTDSEYEERLLSNDSTLPVNGCIKAAHILTGESTVSAARKLVILCKQKGIPVFVYRDKHAWKILDTRKAISLANVVAPANRQSIQTNLLDNPCAPIAELIWKKKKTELSPDAIHILQTINNYADDPLEFDAPKLLQNELIKGQSVDDRIRHQTYDRIISFMRKNKIDWVEGLCQYLTEKWKMENEN